MSILNLIRNFGIQRGAISRIRQFILEADGDATLRSHFPQYSITLAGEKLI